MFSLEQFAFGEALKADRRRVYSFGRAIKDEFGELIEMARNSPDSSPTRVADYYF